MKNKFKYWLILFLLSSIESAVSAMEASGAGTAGRAASSRAVRGIVTDGDYFWDRSASLDEFIYREQVRYDLKMTFDVMLTKNYVKSSSKDEFTAKFRQIGETDIKPNLAYNCGRICNDLIYRYTSAAILDLALKHRSLILADTKIWYQCQQESKDFFIPVAPIDDFVFESERVINQIPSKIFNTTATKIQKSFRGHRVGLHERVYAARVAKVVDDSRKYAAATKIQAAMRGAQVRHARAAATVIDVS